MIHLLSYDLRATGQRYDELIKAIKSYPWAHICESCWAVKTNKTDVELRDELRCYFDDNDSLFVCAVDTWASLNVLKSVNDWLNA